VRGLTAEDVAPLSSLTSLTSLSLPKLLLSPADPLLVALGSLLSLGSLDLGLTPWGAVTEAGVRQLVGGREG
jgi:hypothetical protein